MPSAPQWEIHDRLRKARETAGLTQTQVATRLNKSLNTIYLYEVGHTDISARNLLIWANATNTDPTWILTGQQAGPAPTQWRPGQSNRLITFMPMKHVAGELVDNFTGTDITWFAGNAILQQRDAGVVHDFAAEDPYAPHIARNWKGPYKYRIDNGTWHITNREK